jgi:ribosomal protein L11 methylase PrmA
VVFKAGDVRHWRTTRAVDIITANLYSDLLLEILPKLKRGRWVILSGVLRSQAKEIMAAMRRNQMAIAKVKRRGKWILIVARRARRHEANTARPAR